MSLSFQAWHWQQISIHAESVYPEECCGLLLGQRDRIGSLQLEVVWPTHNAWDNGQRANLAAIAGNKRTGAQSRNFAIAPTDLLQAQRIAREQNWTVLGIYHSHPDHPAQPSDFDCAIAWEQYLYLIVSVGEGQVKDGRLWQLDSARTFQELNLHIIQSPT